MAVPRPILLLSVLGAVLLAATFYTVRGAREQSQSDQISNAVQTAQPQPVAGAKPKAHAPGKHRTAPHKVVANPPSQRSAPAKHKAAPAKPTKPHPARPAPHKDPGAALGLPKKVAGAIGAHKTVVVLFYRRGGADDDATAHAVSSVKGKRVSVFLASPKQFGSYRRLVGGLDLSSLPATVIVGKDRSARVLEGFVDSRTLAQEVADSTR
jgi:hypothetical protein